MTAWDWNCKTRRNLILRFLNKMPQIIGSHFATLLLLSRQVLPITQTLFIQVQEVMQLFLEQKL
jgi:hypothetical protein